MNNSQVYIIVSILFTTCLQVCSKNLLSRLDLFIAKVYFSNQLSSTNRGGC